MRLSVPGLPGLYYDTDAKHAAAAVALSAAARRAPKPQEYALRVLPYLWSFEVDLREVPTEHPIQYLHPEGARSLDSLATNPNARAAGTNLDAILRFVWAVGQEAGTAANGLVGDGAVSPNPLDAGDAPKTVIRIDDGSVAVDGSELETDEFDTD